MAVLAQCDPIGEVIAAVREQSALDDVVRVLAGKPTMDTLVRIAGEYALAEGSYQA